MAVTVAEIRNNDGVVVLKVSGRLDAASKSDFEDAVLPFAKDPEVKRVILDFADLLYVASAGLRVLLMAYKDMKPRGAKFYGANLGDTVLSVLKMTGFLSILTVCGSVDDCLS